MRPECRVWGWQLVALTTGLTDVDLVAVATATPPQTHQVLRVRAYDKRFAIGHDLSVSTFGAPDRTTRGLG